jgi:hypothetical protein
VVRVGTRHHRVACCGEAIVTVVEKKKIPLTRLEDSPTSPQRGEVGVVGLLLLRLEAPNTYTSPRWGEVAAGCRG